MILQQARMVRRGAMEELPERYDRDAVDERFRRVLSAAGRTGEEEEP